MLKQLRSTIQQGRTFSIEAIPSETITSTSHLSQPEAEKKGVVIAMKNNHTLVHVLFKDRKSTGSVRIIDAETLGMGPTHPQFVRKVVGTNYAVIRSEMAV